MASLVTAAVRIKHRLAEEAERARRKAEELERLRREQARQDRAMKRQRFLLKKARDFHRYQRLEALAAHLRTRARESEHEEVARLIEELHSIVEAMRNNFEREVLQIEVSRLGLFTADDLGGSPSPA